jgi:DnaJ family protein C protein 8
MDQASTSSNLDEFMQAMGNLGVFTQKPDKLDAEQEIERLTSKKMYNPYDVLLLDISATQEDMKRQFRAFSLLIHPDKCRHPKATEAFHVIDAAYKTLMDTDKRGVIMRMINEAKDRVTYERFKENKRRVKLGLSELPEETFEAEWKETLTRLFFEVEERRAHYTRLSEAQRQRKEEQLHEEWMKEQIRVLTDEQWENSRDERVKKWREYSSKKHILGTKSSSHEIRPPPVIPEERPPSAPKDWGDEEDFIRPMGINEDYKKNWR